MSGLYAVEMEAVCTGCFSRKSQLVGLKTLSDEANESASNDFSKF